MTDFVTKKQFAQWSEQFSQYQKEELARMYQKRKEQRVEKVPLPEPKEENPKGVWVVGEFLPLDEDDELPADAPDRISGVGEINTQKS